jgi:tetratricopeptide (TPR) repeat protein
MLVLRWVFGIFAIAALLMVADPKVSRLWREMPPRMVIPNPLVFKPYSEEVWAVMKDARAASRAQNHQRAVELYTKALAMEPGPNTVSRDLLAARGSEWNFLDEPEKAFADYDEAIRIGYYAGPTSDDAIRAFMGRGYAAFNLERYALAKKDFDTVLGKLPDDVPRSSSTLAWRGGTWQGLGDREHAVADYKAALALDPKNEYARKGLKVLGEP